MLDEILLRTAINRQASIVTSQHGCEEEMTLEDKRDSIARAIQRIEREIAALPKKNRYRAELGQKKFSLQQEISAINAAIKRNNIRDTDLNEYILAECRRRSTRAQWNEILCAARAAKHCRE